MSILQDLFGDVPQGMTSAVQPFTDPVDVLNDPAGEPTQERWPGALDPTEHQAGQAVPGNSLPADVQYGAEPFESSLPYREAGGGFGDSAWMSGHDGPTVPWDSSAGAPFAPSGAIDPALHGDDTGGVFQKEHVIPAQIGTLTRHTGTGQTNNRVAPTQTAIGNTSPNGRENFDQMQFWNPDGHDPWEIPYAERPVFNNLAYESMPIEPTGSVYTPAGALPNRAVLPGGAMAYEPPPSPDVSYTVPPSAGTSSDGTEGFV
jgi:hypothetical protein